MPLRRRPPRRDPAALPRRVSGWWGRSSGRQLESHCADAMTPRSPLHRRVMSGHGRCRPAGGPPGPVPAGSCQTGRAPPTATAERLRTTRGAASLRASPPAVTTHLRSLLPPGSGCTPARLTRGGASLGKSPWVPGFTVRDVVARYARHVSQRWSARKPLRTSALVCRSASDCQCPTPPPFRSNPSQSRIGGRVRKSAPVSQSAAALCALCRRPAVPPAIRCGGSDGVLP